MRNILGFACVMGISLLLVAVQAADTTEEQQLIAVLQSGRSPQDKDAACARLKRIATREAVPALAGLLVDEQLSHSARYVLESLPGPEAQQALIDSLARTQGLTKVGIVNSLAVRADGQAVPSLIPLLADPDAQTASAAAAALGKCAGPDATKALQTSLATAKEPLRPALADALLSCATRLADSGDRIASPAIFRQLYETEKGDALRQAAYLGMIRTSTDPIALVTAAIAGQDGPSQAAALQAAAALEGPAATKALAGLLTKAGPPVQAALMDALTQRADPAAAPAVAALVTSTDAGLRLAAMRTLAVIGDASQVRPLAEAAASSTGDMQRLARQSLVQLHRGKVTQALLDAMASASPAVAAELSQALGERADSGAVPRLIELAAAGPDRARTSACAALAMLAGKDEVGPLVRLVTEAGSDPVRDAASQALASVCRRLQSRHVDLDPQPIVAAVQAARPAVRLALLPVCGTVVHPLTREVLVKTSADPDPAIRTASVRSACESRDTGLLGHLLKIAVGDADPGVRVLAIRACVRLTQQQAPAPLATQQRIAALTGLLACSSRPEEKRLVLSGLSEVPDPQALGLMVPLLASADTRNEAALAIAKVSGAIAGGQPSVAKDALKKVLAVSEDPAARQAAETLLKQIDANSGHVTAWQVAGPYKQDGKDYAALFDMAFGPEEPNAPGVQWRPLAAGTDPTRPWAIDLLKALGGEQCVAYARTWIVSNRPMAARFEMGSDDGLKVWLNGQLVHVNNTARPLTAGSDKVDVTLKQGRNALLLKITQNNLPWEFCVRVVGPDGSSLEDLRFDALE